MHNGCCEIIPHPSEPRRLICGIYYLWDGATVLYIGQSTDIGKRISRHRATRLDFAGYFIDECPEMRLWLDFSLHFLSDVIELP